MDSIRKARILWQCRRGMLELDLILESFVSRVLHTLSEDDLTIFENLLQCSDPELYAWLTGITDPDIPEINKLVHTIRMCH